MGRASTEFIDAVGDTGRTFYTRLIPDGLGRVPGLGERLSGGCAILDTACGAGVGIVRLAQTYPDAAVVGTDGDLHSLEIPQERAHTAGVDQRVGFIHTPLEEFDAGRQFALVINNISMHECSDPDQVDAKGAGKP